MADSIQVITYHKPKAFKHTVGTDEASSGVVILPFITNPVVATDDLAYIAQVRASGTLIEKTGFKTLYSTTSGSLSVLAEGATTFTAGDIVNCLGMFL